MSKSYYPVLFLEECNCILKEKKVSRFINDNLEIYFDDSDEETSDKTEESCNESDEVSDEE